MFVGIRKIIDVIMLQDDVLQDWVLIFDDIALIGN